MLRTWGVLLTFLSGFLVADGHAMFLLCGGGVGRPDGRGVRALVQPGRGNPGAREHQGPAGATGSQDQSSPLQGRWTPSPVSRRCAGFILFSFADNVPGYRSLQDKKVEATGTGS
jgi:hypothetical protein